jgi:hypothetical protein
VLEGGEAVVGLRDVLQGLGPLLRPGRGVGGVGGEEGQRVRGDLEPGGPLVEEAGFVHGPEPLVPRPGLGALPGEGDEGGGGLLPELRLGVGDLPAEEGEDEEEGPHP